MLYNFGNNQNAIKDFNRALKLSSTNQDNEDYMRYYLETCYLRLNQYEKAIFYYSRSVKNWYGHFADQAVFNRGVCYAELQKFEKAIEDFTRVINWSLSSAEVYKIHGECYHHNKQYQEAIADFKRAMEYDTSLKEECEAAMQMIQKDIT